MEQHQPGWNQHRLTPPPPYGPKTNGKSIAALVLGILSIITPYVGLLIGIAAIIFASLSLKEIQRNLEQGRGMAIAGLVCGIIGTLIYAILFVLLLLMVFLYNEVSVSGL
ncbi:DUF4190 domain-containing protein [Paenibacillus hubeiensis]|uniref:DUF4190 domain-containing protein n=1 Tax=Paenibacillus hubeiensis TaxID=3077330 RepID=UPI0031BAC5C5